MTEHSLKRWRETDGPKLLHAASVAFQGDGPSEEMLSAMLSHVQTHAAVASTPNYDAGTAALPAPAASGTQVSGLALKAWGVGIVLATAIGGWLWSRPQVLEARPSSDVASPVLEVEIEAEAQPPESQVVASAIHAVAAEPVPAAKPKKRQLAASVAASSASRAAPEAPKPAANLAGELELLRRARRALRHAPEQTLSLTAEHAAHFAQGAFREERELLSIEALVSLGKHGAAEQRAQAFRSDFPRSLHLRRLDVVLGRTFRVDAARGTALTWDLV